MNPLRKTRAAALLLLFLVFFRGVPGEASRRTLVILPTLNFTGFEVWESKYYPVNALEQKMTEYLATLLRQDPFADVKILDEGGVERWFAGGRKPGDFAVQMEIFSVMVKEREALGTYERSDISLRVHVYDGGSGQRQDSRIATGKDSRFTFDPGDDRLYFLNARDYPIFGIFQDSILGKIHKDGLDLLRLTPPDKGQKMSRPTWKQFSSTSHWQAFKNAISNAATGISALNDEDFAVIGRIIAPTADSTLKKREYIITLGSKDSLAPGDVLQVIRGDSYITVDPENPVVILPRVIGNIKVTRVMQNESVAVLINEKSKDPVQLNDLVKTSRIGTKKAAPLK
ncbi:MAG: FlgT C-terminal domain-containing protein [Aminivibrio sp.]